MAEGARHRRLIAEEIEASVIARPTAPASATTTSSPPAKKPEKVVKPPRKPVDEEQARLGLLDIGAGQRADHEAASALTASVPQGKAVPSSSMASTEVT